MPVSNCMRKYKNEFIIKFARLMQKNIHVWKELQKIYKRRLYTTALWMYIVGFALGYVPWKHETNYMNNLIFHFWLGVVFIIVTIFFAISNENKNYQKEVKKTFYQKLLTVFGKDIYYGVGVIGNSELRNCGLFNHDIDARTDDDCFMGKYNNVDFIMNETDFGYYTRDNKGRRRYNRMFKGVAMKFKMKKQINSRVLVIKKSLFKYVPRGFEKVELEDIDFSKKYQIYVNKINSTEGQIEARYLLNTAFINRLMQLKTSFKTENLELSVDGDVMLVMLSTSRDLFEMNHLLRKIDDIRQYEHLFDEFASIFSFIDVLNLSSQTRL